MLLWLFKYYSLLKQIVYYNHASFLTQIFIFQNFIPASFFDFPYKIFKMFPHLCQMPISLFFFFFSSSGFPFSITEIHHLTNPQQLKKA